MFSFEESELTDLINKYESYMEEAASAAMAFVENVREVALSSNYIIVMELCNVCINFYAGDVKQTVEGQFDEWADSDGNVVSFIQTMKGGEDAEATARKLQDDLRDKIPTMFPQIDEISTETAHPIGRSEYFDSIIEAAKSFKQTLEEIIQSSNAEINNLSEQNAVYSCIEAPVGTTLDIVASIFDAVATQFDNAKQGFNDAVADAVGKSREETQRMASAAESKAQDVIGKHRRNMDF